MSGWLYEGQHGFRTGYSCQSQLVTVCQDIADSLDEGVRTDTIIDFSKAIDLGPPDRLLTKIAAMGVDLEVASTEHCIKVGAPRTRKYIFLNRTSCTKT